MPPGRFLEPGSFSPDGETLFYQHFTSATQEDIYTLSMRTRKSSAFLQTKFGEGDPQLSPDGVWLAFVSDATGTSEVYVQNLADGSEHIRFSAAGGRNPRWRRDGKELFFVSRSNTVVSATSRSGRWDDAVLADLFPLPKNCRGFAVLPDGQSFLISYTTPGPGDSLFHVVLGE
jgi:Tol biopolymer transport system component